MNHTKGPWVATESHGKPGRYEIREKKPKTTGPGQDKGIGWSIGFKPLAYVQGDKRITGGNGEFNAKIMAASPLFLDALIEIAKGNENPKELAMLALKDAGYEVEK